MPALPPYNPSAVCPKRGHGHVDATYRESGYCVNNHEDLIESRDGPPSPRLCRRCLGCGYAWDEATADAEDTDPAAAADLEVCLTALTEELEALWDDLNCAKQRALNGVWSIECDGLAERIGVISLIVGPINQDSVQVPLLLDGTYERVHAAVGITHAPVDHDARQKWWNDYLASQQLEPQGGTVTPIKG